MVHAPGSLRARLKDSTEQAWRLYCALELAIPHKETMHGPPISRQKLVASTIPWNGAAAGLVAELHAEIRRFEVHLIDLITNVRGVQRGGSGANTRYALSHITRLVDAPAVDDQTVLAMLNYFIAWTARADAVFSPENGMRRLPREPKEKELRCPYCAFQTMRWQPATGIVACINPECRTDTGNRPRWTAELAFDGDALQFSWEAA